MIQRKHSDFFERLTQDIANFFVVLIGKDNDEIEKELDQAYNDWLKLDRKSLDDLHQDKLLPVLLDEMRMDADHIEILANIFKEESKLYYKEKLFLESKNKLEKALKLFDFVDREKQIYSFERQATLQKIKDIISEIELNYKNDNKKYDLR